MFNFTFKSSSKSHFTSVCDFQDQGQPPLLFKLSQNLNLIFFQTLKPHPRDMGGGRPLGLGLKITLGPGLCDRQISALELCWFPSYGPPK